MWHHVDEAPSPTEDAFLSRLMETGATESSSSDNLEQIKEDREVAASEKTRNILHNIVVSINDLWCMKEGLYAAVWKEHPDYGKHSGKCILCTPHFLVNYFQ